MATFTWKAAVNGNWSTSTSWSTTQTNGPGSATEAGESDIVTIGAKTGSGSPVSYTVTLNEAAAWYVGSLTVVGGQTGTRGATSATLSIGSGQSLTATTAGTANGVITIGSSGFHATIALNGGTVNAKGGYTINSDGTISGSGLVQGAINTGSSGTILATGGALELTDNVASLSTAFQVASAAGSVLKLDGSVGSGDTVTLTSGGGAIEFGTSTAATGFGGTIANLNIDTTSATAITGNNFLNFQSGVTKVTTDSAGTTNKFVTSGSTLYLWNGASQVGTIALSSSVSAGDYVDYGTGNAGGLGSGLNVFLDNAVCFAAGTGILTDQGDVPIETLSAGDQVITIENGERVARTVKWIGYRRLDLTRHPRPLTAAPVRIARNAFGQNEPARELVVSPDHSLFVDGKLIPVKLLINGTSIAQDAAVQNITYYHIELDRHAILLAENLPAESYLDTGNRAFFENAGLALVLHPEFEVNAHLKVWETDACAPLAVDPAVVGPIWRRLAERAASLGLAVPAAADIRDADVHLVADGRIIRPLSQEHGRTLFMVPAQVQELRLASRATIPLELVPYHDDPRRLGVSVSRIKVRFAGDLCDIPLDHPALTDGWHPVEQANGRTWRWTDGDALLPIAPVASSMILELHVHPLPAYRRDDDTTPARRAA